MPDSPERPPRGSFSRLALWVAGGGKIAPWCRRNGLAARTAYRWAKTPKFLAKVSELRRRLIDRAVGELARCAAANAAEINRLASKAESEAVRLAAARAGISDLAAMQKHAEFEARLAEIEEKLNDRTRKTRKG